MIEFDVNLKSTFLGLKKRIKERQEIPLEHQKLRFPMPPTDLEYKYDFMSG